MDEVLVDIIYDLVFRFLSRVVDRSFLRDKRKLDEKSAWLNGKGNDWFFEESFSLFSKKNQLDIWIFIKIYNYEIESRKIDKN